MKHTCSNPECKKKMRRAYIVDGKPYCYSCYIKNFNIICSGRPIISLKKALERTYQIKGYRKYKKKNVISAELIVPSVLIGKRVRLVLVDDEESL